MRVMMMMVMMRIQILYYPLARALRKWFSGGREQKQFLMHHFIGGIVVVVRLPLIVALPPILTSLRIISS